MSWTGPEELKAQVQKFWDRGYLLATLLDGSLEFPLRLKIKAPSSRELADEFQAAREWSMKLGKTRHIRIEYRTIGHRTLGENSIPHTAWLDSLEDAACILRNQAQF